MLQFYLKGLYASTTDNKCLCLAFDAGQDRNGLQLGKN